MGCVHLILCLNNGQLKADDSGSAKGLVGFEFWLVSF